MSCHVISFSLLCFVLLYYILFRFISFHFILPHFYHTCAARFTAYFVHVLQHLHTHYFHYIRLNYCAICVKGVNYAVR